MAVREIEAKSILRKHKKIDSWFLARYGMNLYRGCVHNCVYCDGRAEKYNVEGEFGRDIDVKTNAPAILDRELDPQRKRKPFKKSFIVLGGGVGDSYQPIEEKYNLTRLALGLIEKYNFPVHVLTKSTLVQRDIDILSRINKNSRAMVSVSFSTADDRIGRFFEPGIRSPRERFEVLKLFKDKGIPCGLFLLPVIPFISDSEEKIEEIVSKSQELGLDFIIFGGMTLKEGRQKDHFIEALRRYDASLIPQYREIYKRNEWGAPESRYYDTLMRRFHKISHRYNVPTRIPQHLFDEILDENDRVIVLLEHIEYYSKILGRKSPYGYAAFSISKLKVNLSTMKDRLQTIPGVGPATEKIILEILDTGSSSYYKKLQQST